MPKTISFSEKNKGWTSFHSFIPEAMTRLNNRFFSFKNGQLYLHNDTNNAIRNNFYGTQYSSQIKTIFNDDPELDKIFKTLVLEGTHAWEAEFKTNYTNSTIKKSEFNKKESRWFGYTRKNVSGDFTGHAAQGIGNILSVNGNEITFANVSEITSIGDTLQQYTGGVTIPIGEITDIQDNVITIGVIQNAPIPGTFALSIKDSRIEGSEIRGYYLEVNLTNDDTEAVELFAINSNAVKSYI